MKNINSFNTFLNENNRFEINYENFEQFKSKLLVLISNENDSNLRKGFEFVSSNIHDYMDDSFTQKMSDIFFNNINILISKKYKNFFKEEDKGYSGNKSVGNRYKDTLDLDIKEISKLIKNELSIYYPEWQFSVKISRFSGGESINVNILDIPYNPYSESVDNLLKNNLKIPYNRTEEYYNKLYLKDIEKIKTIINQYNYDDSNSMVDYFDKRYYSHLNLDEHSIKKKFYPENDEVKRIEDLSKKWDDNRKKKKEITDAKKGKFKKGEEVIYIYNKENAVIPKGEYKAIILKSPNGRALFSKYEIRFWIDKKKKNGEIINLEQPIAYLTTVYNENELKKI